MDWNLFSTMMPYSRRAESSRKLNSSFVSEMVRSSSL